MKKLIFILFFLPFILSTQDKEKRSVKVGWAIHIGAGNMYGGNIGLLLERQIYIKEKLHVSPFVSAGIDEGRTDLTTSKR